MDIDELLHRCNASHRSKATTHGCAALLLYGFGALVAFGLLLMVTARLRLGIPLSHLFHAALGISLLFLVVGWIRARVGAHRTPCGVGDTSNPLYTPLHGSPYANDPASRMRRLLPFGSAWTPETHPDSPDRLFVRLLFGSWHEWAKAIQAHQSRVILSATQRIEAQRILDWLATRASGSKFHDISGCNFDVEVLETLIRGKLLRFSLEGETPCLMLDRTYHDVVEQRG